MKALHIGKKLVSTKHAEDEPKLGNNVPWRFVKPVALDINKLTHHSDPAKASHSQRLD